MKKELINIANELDSRGLRKEADALDELIKSAGPVSALGKAIAPKEEKTPLDWAMISFDIAKQVPRMGWGSLFTVMGTPIAILTHKSALMGAYEKSFAETGNHTDAIYAATKRLGELQKNALPKFE
jgi:hypothetical protein